MEKETSSSFPRIHGKYRIEPVPAGKEEGGKRAVPAKPGITYVLLTAGNLQKIFEIKDTDKYDFVDEIPAGAKLAVENFGSGMGFNRIGEIPLVVCNKIKLALDIQNLFTPKINSEGWVCPCESCQFEMASQEKTP